MRMLLVVIKNTSVLDYAVPIFRKLKGEIPGADAAVLYCDLSRRSILRRHRFYSRIFRGCGIPEHDFADFLRPPWHAAGGLVRRVFGASRRDTDRNAPILAPAKNWFLTRSDVRGALSSLAPDIVLLDNRTLKDFYGSGDLFEELSRFSGDIVLLPHAPHHTGTDAFTPFRDGDALPPHCEYWLPFVHDEPWIKLPAEKRPQFHYAGYPGLDSGWLESLRGPAAAGPPRTPLRCLFIIRRYIEKGKAWPAGHDAYIYTYEEFARFVSIVKDAVGRSRENIEVTLKPHPSNDRALLKSFLRNSGLRHWRVSEDSVYADLGRTDFAISLYSTTGLIPAMAGIPVVFLHSRVQDDIHRWEEMKELYTGLRFYLADPLRLGVTLREVVRIARDARERQPDAEADGKHLRKFFPDGAAGACFDRLRAIAARQNPAPDPTRRVKEPTHAHP